MKNRPCQGLPAAPALPPSLRGLLACALTLAAALPLQAQETDTTQAAPPPDTLVALPTSERPAVRFADPEPGRAVGDTLPARLPALDAVDLLAGVPGSFTYDFGTPGWPHGWSPLGFGPQQVALLLDGRPFDDPVTGRPRYDLLPFEFVLPLRTAPTRYGAPYAVYAQTRPLLNPRPYTELRYRTGSEGLTAIAALHAQRRRLSLFGRPGVLGLLFGYGGRSADGEYPGSQLDRERRLYLRLQYEQVGWSIEISNLRIRRRLGAQGGVVQRGSDPNSIYQRLDAVVRNPDAQRKTYRNDLALTARARLLPGLDAPFALTTYWTAQTFGYDNPGLDTLRAETDRYGFFLRQDLPIGTHRLGLRLEGWADRLTDGDALPSGLTRQALHFTVRDSLSLLGFQTLLEGGLHDTGTNTFASALAGIERRLGSLTVFADASLTGQPISWVEQYGFGPFVLPVRDTPAGRLIRGRFGFALRGETVDLLLQGFAHETTDPLDLYVVREDTIQARIAPAPFRRAGITIDLGWRRSAGRGIYAAAQATFMRLLDAGASPEHEWVAASLPDVFGQGRLGARLSLFKGDLILDAYLLGRFWSGMQSRALHPPTGLLVVPPAGAGALAYSPSGVLDAYVEANVRTARLFMTYENFLSGTTLLPGTLVVAPYPLPERAFRFGVFWPIFD